MDTLLSEIDEEVLKMQNELISERDYQKRNDEYKLLVSQFSQAYLDFCEWYVGPELPRETFLDDKDSIYSLYFMFMMSMFLKST